MVDLRGYKVKLHANEDKLWGLWWRISCTYVSFILYSSDHSLSFELVNNWYFFLS